MKHYDDFEDELDDIRTKLYEETKHMSPSEFVAHINAEADRICKEFGITMKRADTTQFRKRKGDVLTL